MLLNLPSPASQARGPICKSRRGFPVVSLDILASEFVHPLFQLLCGLVLDHNSPLTYDIGDDLQEKLSSRIGLLTEFLKFTNQSVNLFSDFWIMSFDILGRQFIQLFFDLFAVIRWRFPLRLVQSVWERSMPPISTMGRLQ